MSQPIGFATPNGRSSSAGSQGLGTSPTQRKYLDIVDLSSNGFEIKIAQDDLNEIYVKLHIDPMKYPQLNVAPECPYVGGVWWLHIELPQYYPQTSPSVGFVNPIYHPNVEERSGSICLDVLNQTWSPMFTLTHALCNFLTQLLMYPNPHDPMNGDAAILLLQDEEGYRKAVIEHTKNHATEAAAAQRIAQETLNRDFYTPERVVKRGSRGGVGGEPGRARDSSASGMTPPTPTDFSTDHEESIKVNGFDDDDVSSASDIDIE